MCHLPTNQQGTMVWKVSCAGAERRTKMIWFVAECLFTPMEKLRRKETRKEGGRDHKDLFSLDLYSSLSLKTRQSDFGTPDYFIPDGYLR